MREIQRGLSSRGELKGAAFNLASLDPKDFEPLAARALQRGLSQNFNPSAREVFEEVSRVETASGVIFGLSSKGEFVIRRPPDLFFESERRAELTARWRRVLSAPIELLELGQLFYVGDRWLVTARKSADVLHAVPVLGRALQKAEGKVVFLGNGLSTLPLEIAGRPEGGPVLAADMIDIPALGADLAIVAERLKAKDLPNPYLHQLDQAKELLRAVKAGRLELCRSYIAEGGAAPAALGGASLIINYNGPPSSTIKEQCELLAPRGKLYYVPHTALFLIDEERFSLSIVPGRAGQSGSAMPVGWRVSPRRRW